MMKRKWHHHGPTNTPVRRGGHEGAVRATSAPLALSQRKDLLPQGMAFAVSPPGAVSWQDCFPPGRLPQSLLGHGNSVGLKNKSLEAHLETGMDVVEAQRQHLLPQVPAVGTNKGKCAEATKLQLLLSSFYSHLNVPRVSMFRRWFY